METRQSSRKDYFRRALRLTCTLMLSLWMASFQNPVSSQNAVRDQGPVTDKSSRARAVELISPPVFRAPSRQAESRAA